MSFFDNLAAELIDSNIMDDSLSEYLYLDTQYIYEIFIKNSCENIDINTLSTNTPCEIFEFDELDYISIILACDNKLHRDSDELLDSFKFLNKMFSKDIAYFIKRYLQYSKPLQNDKNRN